MALSELTSREVAELYRRYGFFLRRRCLVLLRHPSAADDAMQEIFLKLLRAGSGVREADEPLRWLYRVTDRACFDQLRRKKRTPASIDDVDLPAAPGVDPDVRRAAIELLATLDEEDQTIAVMAFVDGMNQQEIADELGYSRMTIIKRMTRLRERAQRRASDS